MRILLVRHGQSQANVNKRILLERPDHDIGLSDLGHEQAKKVARWLHNKLLGAQHSVRLWNSPYFRARQTAGYIGTEIEDMSLGRGEFTSREEIAFAEQQFGLFDGVYDDELAQKFPLEYAHYKKCEDFEGKFWARMPLGESRFDVAIRVKNTFGTLVRDADRHNIQTHIIVCHGVTARAFVMQWCHLTPEWFEKQANLPNCGVWELGERGINNGLVYDPAWR